MPSRVPDWQGRENWSLVVSEGLLSSDDRRRLAQGRMRRERPGKVARDESVKELHGGWAEFLGRFPLDTFFTLTYSDRYAAEHRVYALTSALNDFERWVERTAFTGQYFVAAEPHFDRDVPHLHGLLQRGDLDVQELWRRWFTTRGRAKVEVPRTDAAQYYCSKYSLKEADPDTVRMRLATLTRKERREEGRA